MNEINSLATSLSTYGVYSIVGVLCVCVVYLFKQVNMLHQQIQQLLTDLATKTTIALEKSNETIEKCTKALDKD